MVRKESGDCGTEGEGTEGGGRKRLRREVETEKGKRGLIGFGEDCIGWREDGEVLSLWDQSLGSVLEG